MPSVLFVCTANQYRSPVAAALFESMLSSERCSGTWIVNSAGTWTTPGLPLSPLAKRLARECGLILEGHHTRLVSESLLFHADLILVMEAGHREALLTEFPSIAQRVFLLSEVVDGVEYDIPDPAASYEHAEAILQELCRLIERGFPQILRLATVLYNSRLNSPAETQSDAPSIQAPARSIRPARQLRPDPSDLPSVAPAQTPDNHPYQAEPFSDPAAQSAAEENEPGRPVARLRRLLLWLLPIVLVGWGGFRAWRMGQLGEKVLMDIQQLEMALQAVPQGAGPMQIGSAVAAMRHDLKALQEQAAPLLWMGPLLGWVPVHGGDLASAAAWLDLGNDLALSAEQTYQALLPITTSATNSFPDASALLDALAQARPGLEEARASLERAKQTRQRIHLEALSPNLRRLLSDKVDPALSWLDDGLTLADSLPSILGAGTAGPRTYLLLIQNADELRPSGGFITAVGTLVVEDGRLLSLTFKDSNQMEDWSKPYPLVPWQLEQYMNSPVLIFRDSNWFVDFPTSAEYARYLYRLAQPTPVAVDGVVAFNQHTLISLLEALGPIQVESISITAENAEDYMHKAKIPPSTDATSGDWYRKAFIQKIAQAVLERLRSPVDVDAYKLSGLLLRLLAERQILLQFEDPGVAQVLARRGWDGAVRPEGTDFLYVVDSNIGFNKTNAVVTEQLSYDVDLSDLAHPTSQLSVTHTNHASANSSCLQWNEEREAGEWWYPIHRCYWDYLRIYQSSEAVLVDSTPHAVPRAWTILEQEVPPRVDILDEEISGARGYGTLLVVPGGQSLTTTFKFALPPGVLSPLGNSDQSVYRLKVQKQAGTLAVPLTVRIHFPRQASLVSLPPGAVLQDNNVMLQTALKTDLRLEIVVRLP